MKVAVVGSREGVDLGRVHMILLDLHRKHPDAVVVSGGAGGVDTFAEQMWLKLGGKVISFRLVKVNNPNDNEYGIQKWELGGENPMVYMLGEPHPNWADWKSAAYYRNALVAEEADRGLAFRYRGSRGTGDTIECFVAEGKPIYVYEEG